MQLCSPAEMRASFKLNFFVFHNVHQKKIFWETENNYLQVYKKDQ